MELEEDDDNVTVDGVDSGDHRDRERRHRRPHHHHHHSAIARGDDEPVDDAEPDEEDSHMMADDSTDRGESHASAARSGRLGRLDDEVQYSR